MDTPEMRPSMIMRTLRLVWDDISLDFHTIRTPEMRTTHYSVKWTLGLGQQYHRPYKLTLIADTLARNFSLATKRRIRGQLERYLQAR